MVLSLNIICSFLTQAQTGIITRYTYTANKQELPGSTALLEGITLGTASNASGYLTLNNIPSEKYTLLISLLGYTSYIETVTIRGGQTIKLNVAGGSLYGTGCGCRV